MSKSLKITLVIVVLLAAGVGEWFYLKGPNSQNNPENKGGNGQTDTVVVQTNLTGKTKLPSGFPSDIPVEVSGVTDSYKATYPQGVTQYTVTYTSNKSKDELFDLYYNYMTNGYSLETSTSRKLGQLVGTRDGNTLSVLISGTPLTVKLNYLAKTD